MSGALGAGLGRPPTAPSDRCGHRGGRDALLIADDAELVNGQNLAEGARRSEVWQAPIDGHGAEPLPDPRVRERVLAWFRDRLSEPDRRLM